MTNETDSTQNRDGNNITNDELIRNETETKENQVKEPKSVSFNRDVHIKRFGKPRESRSSSTEHQSPIRKEPFTHLSEQELIEEADKVRAQAQSVTCTADQPPEKFYSLPHRKKNKQEVERRNSDDAQEKKSLGRSVSDVSSKRKRERTSLSTLFRRAQKKPEPIKVAPKPKPTSIVKRSKSDVSDLKSNNKLNPHPKPIRKRSGSETEEFLKSLRNKKGQLTPIIENSPNDYARKTPPLEVYQKKKLSEKKETEKSPERKVNPVEKPPRYKSPDKEPKPPIRAKRGKSLEKELEESQPITSTPKRKVEPKKKLLVDEIDSVKGLNSVEIKDKIKESIRKIEENVYGTRDMIHSSQKPPEKPPLTRGNTVDHMVRILKEDQHSPPPRANLLSPHNSTNNNQPFSYIKPSVSPDPNLFTRNSPDRIPSPVNKMDKGVVYAQVVRDQEQGTNQYKKQTIHKTYSKEKYGNMSDEDEGLGYEDRYKTSPKYDYEFKNRDKHHSGIHKITDSPIRPRFREYKLTSFDDFEPTYANEYTSKDEPDFVETTLRGRADGMDSKRKTFVDDKIDLDFNELSHRRQLLESRLNARMYDRDRPTNESTMPRYLVEKDPIYEAEKRMKATEKYVNETARYYRQTLEKDGFAESNITEDFNRFDSDNNNVKYNTESRSVEKVPKGDVNRRDYIDRLSPRFKDDPVAFPPEPEYEPPSLESNPGKNILTPNEYTEKKYKVRSKHVTTSHDVLQTGSKYKRDDSFGKRKGHYASNPEIAQEREDDYANAKYDPKQAESYHNSLRRERQRKYNDYTIRRHDSGDSRDSRYRDDRSPRKFDFDSRLVDSGIENDFRKDSNGDIHKARYKPYESDDDVRDTSLFLDSERRHTEDNYPSEQIYANGEYITRFEARKENSSRERSADNGSNFEPKDRFDKSPSANDDKISAKPPKATKKLSGLEKVKQLFSRDSSKKSKKEKEVQPKPRTRVLKSPEHLADDPEYRRFQDPVPSDEDRRREYRSSREDLDRYRSSDPRDSDPERYIKEERYNAERNAENRYRVQERTYREERKREEKRERRFGSSDRESNHRSPRPSDGESDLRVSRKSRSRDGPLDSPALAERNRERRRLATPSPTPSPPRRSQPTSPPAPSLWMKSLDRITNRKKKVTKVENHKSETEEESTKQWNKKTNSPAKNLRFFGDTDVESDTNAKHSTLTKTRSSDKKSHPVLKKTTSNSSTGIDEPDRSYSLNNLHREDRERKYYRRNLHNISETRDSENDSQFSRRVEMKPPISPYDRRSRSQSSSKTMKPDSRLGSRTELRHDDRGSSEVRGSKLDLNRDTRHRRRTPGHHSGESSTEGESSHPSQKSVVFLHATTVGDIPDPGRLGRNRSRDDVSSVNSSNLHIKTTQKSFSLFAPWTPRHYNETNDVHYAQKPRRSSRLSEERNERPSLQKKKSYSQTTLTRRPQNSRLSNSTTTLNRKKRDEPISREQSRSRSNEVLAQERLPRSASMPKDKNKKADWFNRLSNKNKKQEINTRVR